MGDLAAVDMPIHVLLIDHPKGRILVDTGLTQLNPLVADMDPQLHPLTEHALDLGSIDIVRNDPPALRSLRRESLFPDTPIYMQRCELDDARTKGGVRLLGRDAMDLRQDNLDCPGVLAWRLTGRRP